MDTVVHSWQRIDAWLETFAPSCASTLRPGVSLEELALAEAKIGLTLPADFKASYQIHNGAASISSYLLMGFPDFYALDTVVWSGELPRELGQEWATRQPDWIEYGVQPVWRHPAWLDFAGNGAGDTWCIDLAPAPGGCSGQILYWSHEVGVDAVLFQRFEELLSTYADQLEAGLYLGSRPLIALGQLTRLQERRAAFQRPSPAKPLLHQAMKSAWDRAEADYGERSLSIFRQVLRMEDASPEDRFFAYYGLKTLGYTRQGYYDQADTLVEQELIEVSKMPVSHWIRQEVALWGAAGYQ